LSMELVSVVCWRPAKMIFGVERVFCEERILVDRLSAEELP